MERIRLDSPSLPKLKRKVETIWQLCDCPAVPACLSPQGIRNNRTLGRNKYGTATYAPTWERVRMSRNECNGQTTA